MIRRYLGYILLSLFAILVAACSGAGSGGTPRTGVDLEAYGLIRGATVVDKQAYSVEFLQNRLTPQNFNGTATGVCDTLTTDPKQDWRYNAFIRMLCLNNIVATRDEARKNIGDFDPRTFVIGTTLAKENNAGVGSTLFYRFIYNTPGASYVWGGGTTTPQDVSGLIIVPRDAAGNALTPDKIKGVVLYYHPTIFSKIGVPSGFDAPESSVELVNYTLYTDFMLAAVYASQGFVVVAPDYVGQGVNKDVMHPYVAFAETNALSGIYALKAARTALSRENINLPNKAKLYITSYSEGGAYALWTSKLIQGKYGSVLDNSGYELRRTAGISGAYDVSDTTFNYMYDNVRNDWNKDANVWNISPGMFESGLEFFGTRVITESDAKKIKAVALFEASGSKAILSTYMLTSMIYYNTTTHAYDTLVNNREFALMKNCLNIPQYASSGDTLPLTHFMPCEFNYSLSGLFNNSVLNPRQIFSQVLAAAGTTGFITGDKPFNTALVAMQNGEANNSIKKFLHNDIRSDQVVMPLLSINNIFDWQTSSPIELIYIRYDSILPNQNSLKACGKVPGVPNVKDQSSPAMVSCTEVDNTKFWQQTVIPGLPERPVMFADHAWIEPSLQIVALTKFLVNP
jgi:hypothetical protein